MPHTLWHGIRQGWSLGTKPLAHLLTKPLHALLSFTAACLSVKSPFSQATMPITIHLLFIPLTLFLPQHSLSKSLTRMVIPCLSLPAESSASSIWSPPQCSGESSSMTWGGRLSDTETENVWWSFCLVGKGEWWMDAILKGERAMDSMGSGSSTRVSSTDASTRELPW